MEVRRLIEVTGTNSDGTPFTGQMYETLHGTRGKAQDWMKWNTCHLCGMDFPINKMMYKDGKYYCYKYKCYQDLLPKEIKS